MELTSSVFENGGKIPAKYTCDEDRLLSPPLSISGIPESAASLALIMDDPDVRKEKHPSGVFNHWVLFNIPPDTTEILEGRSVGTAGVNGRGEMGYRGPCPPPEYEPAEHRYIFKLYAIKGDLHFANPPTKQEVLDAIQGKTLAGATLIGRYSRR